MLRMSNQIGRRLVPSWIVLCTSNGFLSAPQKGGEKLMKKILLSVLSLGVVAAVAVFATQAYFSDTEKSVGNTFTAGKLDLIFQADNGNVAGFTDVTGRPLFDTANFQLPNDLKPGDKGEKTVKLWVDNNPSCGKVSINVTEDKDNSCTEPELIDDPTCVAESNTTGELNDQVNFAVWEDPNCNNTLDGSETILVSGPLTGDRAYNIGRTSYNTKYCKVLWNCILFWNLEWNIL